MKKIKNLAFILVFILFSIGIIELNIHIDPYNVRGIKYDNSLHWIPRDLVYTFLNLYKQYKYNTVFLTGSSGYKALNMRFSVKRNIALIDMYGISPTEQYDLLKYYLKLHPETKNIIVSLENNTYLPCNNKYTIPNKPTSKLEDFIKLYFSIDTTKKSLQIYFQPKGNSAPEEVDNNVINSFNTSGRLLYNETCEYDNFKSFKKIHELIQEHNLNAIYFIPPAHGLYLAHLDKQGYYENTLNLKKQFASIISFYDFSFINRYTTLPPEYLFIDVVHINGDIISNKVFNIITNKEKDDNFAMYITKDNVDEAIIKQRKLLQNYIKNNQDTINNYINNDTKLLSEKEIYKKAYLNDLPKDLQELYNQNEK